MVSMFVHFSVWIKTMTITMTHMTRWVHSCLRKSVPSQTLLGILRQDDIERRSLLAGTNTSKGPFIITCRNL